MVTDAKSEAFAVCLTLIQLMVIDLKLRTCMLRLRFLEFKVCFLVTLRLYDICFFDVKIVRVSCKVFYVNFCKCCR